MSIFLRRIPLILVSAVVFLQFIIIMIILNFFQVKYIITQDYFSPLLYEQGGKNLLIFDKEAFVKAIEEENPKIKNVTLKKKYPSTLIIRFERRNPLFKVTDRNRQSFFLVDEAGVVFEVAREDIKLPVIVTSRISLKNGVVLDNPTEKTAIKIVRLIRKTDLKLDRLIIKENQILAILDSIELVFRREDVDPIKLKALQFLVKRFTIEGKQPKKIDFRFNKPIVEF